MLYIDPRGVREGTALILFWKSVFEKHSIVHCDLEILVTLWWCRDDDKEDDDNEDDDEDDNEDDDDGDGSNGDYDDLVIFGDSVIYGVI